MSEVLQKMAHCGIGINVVFLAKLAYPRGMAGTKRVQLFIDYLKSRDIGVALLLLNHGKSTNHSEETGCYKDTCYRRIGSNLKPDLTLIWRLPSYVWSGFTCLQKWKIKNQKNILYCYGGPNIENISFVLLARMLGYKTVFDIVEDYSVAGPLSGRRITKLITGSLIFFEKFIRYLADGLVVISRHLHVKYEDAVKRKDTVRLIPVSAHAREPRTREAFNRPARIVYSGSFAAKDGVDNLVAAFNSLRTEERGIELILTGKGTEEDIATVKGMIAGSKAIRYLGYLEDEDYYRFILEADILCMTRIDSNFANAGFPFKLGEYLATGNPVIASECSDVSYYLENMKDAVLTKPGDIQALKAAMQFLLKEQKTALNIGRAGREKCRRYFDPGKNGALLFDLFKSI